MAPTETQPSLLGYTLVIVARVAERLAGILQHHAQYHAQRSAQQTASTTTPEACAAPVQSVSGESTDIQPHGSEPLMPRSPPVPPPAGERNKRSIPQDVKIAVSVRDGGRCRQCGSIYQLHFDHVIPLSRGGANTVANIQLLCGVCNRAKSARLKLAALAFQVIQPGILKASQLSRLCPITVGPVDGP